LFLFEVVLGTTTNSQVLRVVQNLIVSSYLDRNYTNDAWDMKSVATLQNDFLEQQYM